MEKLFLFLTNLILTICKYLRDYPELIELLIHVIIHIFM